MSLKLLPGIVWALDEPALALVRQWWNGLPHRAQSVFTVAGSWEEFTEIIAIYREARFDEAILNAGLSLEPQQRGPQDIAPVNIGYGLRAITQFNQTGRHPILGLHDVNPQGNLGHIGALAGSVGLFH